MRGRGQLLAALLTVGVVVSAAVWLQRGVGTKAFAGPAPAVATSGAWFCPHGGGAEWQDRVQVANPGVHPVRIRVTTLSESRPGRAKTYTVEPGTEVQLPEPGTSRAASTVVEYFGGWVAASWVAHAGGGETGVAAEPCSPTAGQRWLLPDGSTQLAESAGGPQSRRSLDSYVVVMNPFAVDAVFSLTLYTDKDAPVRAGEWTNVDLQPFRTRAFHLNDQRLGYATVSATVDAKVGRVVASSLDVSAVGGIRASLGQLAPVPGTGVYPGAFDQGRTELVLMNPTGAQAQVTGSMLGNGEPAPLSGPEGDRANADSAQTFPQTTDGPTSFVVDVPAGTAVVRRTYGESSDSAATGPARPAGAWVLLPAVGGPPYHSGAVLANPGSQPIEVRLSYLPSGTQEPAPAPITVHVPAQRTVTVPAAFVQARPLAAILAVSENGTFVPAEASYSLGLRGYAAYAVALGVPIPARWTPTAP
jgi:uncharacterized protein DUF5719